MIKQYIAYLKNNPDHYWFKRKMYGWGWVPATREGWIVVIGFIILFLLNGFFLSLKTEPEFRDIIWFFLRIFFLILVLFWICFKKGEKPRWQWGSSRKK
jgi:hypothetical protein